MDYLADDHIKSPWIIGLDLGTTRCKALLVDQVGQARAMSDHPYAVQSPRPGWVVQQPQAVWGAVQATLRDLAAQRPAGQPVAALALSGAMHSLFPVDGQGTPRAPAMTWADQRASKIARALRTEHDPLALYQRTGCPLTALYYPARLRWYQAEGEPDALYVGLKEWILFQLGGGWTMDYGMASTSGLLNIHTLAWEPEALALAGIHPGQLPALTAPQAVGGTLTHEAASLTGWPQGLPLIVGTSDGGTANLGAGATRSGQQVITVGTSGAVRRVVDRPQLDPQARHWCYLLAEGRWFIGAAINNGGLAVQWVRERLYADLQGAAGYEQLLADAATIEPGAAGLSCLPYFSGERPPAPPGQEHATFHGLSLAHQRAHLARAVLEGVAFSLAERCALLGWARDADSRLTGRITQMAPWPQLLADLLATPLRPIAQADASALGAARLGFWAIGQVDSLDEGEPPAAPLLQPDAAQHARYQAPYHRFRILQRELAHAMSDL